MRTVLIAAVAAFLFIADSGDDHLVSRVRGVTFDARHRPSSEALERLVASGARHVSVTPYGWQKAHDDPVVHLRPDAGWFTENDEGITWLARELSLHGVDLIIKPQVWIRDGAAGEFYAGVAQTKKWRADIQFESEEDWRRWEDSYRKFVIHYARLARDVDAYALCIGTELTATERVREKFWRDLTKDVRSVFSGKIIYAANWYESYEHVPFWDAVDFVGVQAYFPVSDQPRASMGELMEGWEVNRYTLEKVANRTGKPILFTEIGYRSVAYAASKPWIWPNRSERGSIEADTELQARLYEAFFRTFWDEPWFAGAIVWKWHGDDRSPERMSVGFTPQGKPAAGVMKRYFSR